MNSDKKSANTIKLCIYFHTSGNGITLEPKVAEEEGWVSMPTNHRHGIRASAVGPVYFDGRSQGDLMKAIRECLKANGIKFIKPDKLTEYRKYQEAKNRRDLFDENLNL